MKILYFLVVPTDERFAVLDDAIVAGRNAIGVAAVFANGLKVLLKPECATIAEYQRVAREHAEMFRRIGRKMAWYECEVG